MKPVTQTITTIPGGNCFAACVASLLELPLEQVPNFCNVEGDWFKAFQDWLGERGLFCFEAEFTDKPTLSRVPAGAFCIISGKSPRGDGLHSVVARGAWNQGYELVHDPHPDGGWFAGEPKYVTFIVALDPARAIRETEPNHYAGVSMATLYRQAGLEPGEYGINE